MKISALALGALVCLAPSLNAALITYRGTLSANNEVPPTGSPATGLATVIVDDIANTISLNVVFSNLVAVDTAAHIHCCTAPTAGVATAVPAFPGFPLGVTSGSYINSFSLLDPSFWNPAFITANGGSIVAARTALLNGLAAGNAYLNVHSSTFPGGEIRANLAAVPEPASLGMMAAGIVALVTMRRRFRS